MCLLGSEWCKVVKFSKKEKVEFYVFSLVQTRNCKLTHKLHVYNGLLMLIYEDVLSEWCLMCWEVSFCWKRSFVWQEGWSRWSERGRLSVCHNVAYVSIFFETLSVCNVQTPKRHICTYNMIYLWVKWYVIGGSFRVSLRKRKINFPLFFQFVEKVTIISQ